MSVGTFTQESEDADMLWKVVKDVQFLKYDHSIEQIKPSQFSFPVGTEYSGVSVFSEVGMDVIKDFLHIGIVSDDSSTRPLNRSPILLLVWPRFVSPAAYSNRRCYLPGIKFSEENHSLYEVIAATAILTPVKEWKFLERLVIASFYHFTFDKPTTDAHGNINVWQNFSKDKLEKGWRQLLFLCCGPQGLAYLVKRMLKRNWAKIGREATSMDTKSNNNYTVFCTGGAVQLLIEWSKFSFKQDALLKFLEEVNSVKPAMPLVKVIERAQKSFSQHVASSKRNRCNVCPYEADNNTHFQHHLRKHTGERPFVCDVCNEAFSHAVDLKRHKITKHTGKYPYQCA